MHILCLKPFLLRAEKHVTEKKYIEIKKVQKRDYPWCGQRRRLQRLINWSASFAMRKATENKTKMLFHWQNKRERKKKTRPNYVGCQRHVVAATCHSCKSCQVLDAWPGTSCPFFFLFYFFGRDPGAAAACTYFVKCKYRRLHTSDI